MPDEVVCCDDVSNSVARAWEQHKRYLYKFIYSSIKNKHLADDICQEVYLGLLKRCAKENTGYTKNFLRQAAIHCIINHARRAASEEDYIKIYAESLVSQSQVDPMQVAINVEQTERIFNSVYKQLSDKESLAIMMLYKENRKTTDVAKIMRIKERSVKRNLDRGIKKLKTSPVKNEILMSLTKCDHEKVQTSECD
jgi:RNA polymerase sigma factor (sigma-70 family)